MKHLESYTIEVSIPKGIGVNYSQLRPTGEPMASVRFDNLVFDAYIVSVEVSLDGDTRLSLVCTGAPRLVKPCDTLDGNGR